MTTFDKFLKYGALTALTALFFVPFIVSGDLLFPFITGKAFLFRVLIGIAFTLWLILAIRRPEFRPKKNCILISLILFLIVIGIANIQGLNPYQSFWSVYERMEGYVTLLHLFAFFLVATSLINTKKSWFNVLAFSTFVSIIMIWLGFAQLANPETISQGGRLDATFGNPIYLAIYNLFHIFFALILIFNRDYFQKNWLKWTFGIIGLLHLIILYFTLTRGAVLGLVIGLGIVFLVNIFTLKKVSPKIWQASFGLIIVGIILLSLFFTFKDSQCQFVKGSVLLSRFAEISLTSGTSEARLLSWGIAFEGFKESPILGFGMGNYGYVFDKYYNPKMHGNEAWFDHVHNIVLDWLIAGGILGLLSYLLIFASLIFAIYRAKNYSPLEKNLFVGLVTAYFVQNLFVFDSQVTYLSFFIILAMFAIENQKELKVLAFTISKPMQNVSAGIVLLAGAFLIYNLNAPGYLAAKNLIDSMRDITIARQMLQVNQPVENVRARIDSAISNMKKAIDRKSFGDYEIVPWAIDLGVNIASMPPEIYPAEKRREYIQYAFSKIADLAENYSYDAKAQYVTGLYFLRFRDLDNAMKYFERMLQASPNKQVTRFALYDAFVALGQNEKALAFAKETYELEPSKDTVWLEYYFLALRLDNKKIADELLQEAIENQNENRLNLIAERLSLEIERKPDNVNGFVSLAAFYFQINQIEKSLEILNSAKEKFPELEKSLNEAIKQIQAGENPLGKSF